MAWELTVRMYINPLLIVASINLAVLPNRLVLTKARERADHPETMELFVVIYIIIIVYLGLF